MSTAASTGRGAPAGRHAADDQRPSARETWNLLRELLEIEPPRFKAITNEFGLLPPHVVALERLARGEPMAMGELGAKMDSDKSTMTWIADQLEERGLVERRSDPRDRRVKLLALTDTGRRLYRDLDARMGEPPPALAALAPDDQQVLRDVLKRALEGQRADPG